MAVILKILDINTWTTKQMTGKKQLTPGKMKGCNRIKPRSGSAVRDICSCDNVYTIDLNKNGDIITGSEEMKGAIYEYNVLSTLQ